VSVADRETGRQTTEETRDRGKRAVATIAARKPRKSGQTATRETAKEIGHGSERICTIVTTGKRQTTAARETAEETGHRSKQATGPVATAGQTRQAACNIAKRAVIAPGEETGHETRLTEQHARQVLTEKIFTKAAFTRNAETGKLGANRTEGEIVRQSADHRVKTRGHGCECVCELFRQSARQSAITTTAQHTARTQNGISEFRQAELFRDTIFTGDTERRDAGDTSTATTTGTAAPENRIIGGAGRCEEHCTCSRYEFCCLHGHEPILPSRR
jgi:hypothetical protein